MHFTWLLLEVTRVYRVMCYLARQGCVWECVFEKGYGMYLPLHATLNECPSLDTFSHTNTHTLSHPLIYPTRIQLLNSASGSIASWLHHLANPPVISSNSLHPLSSYTHRVRSWPPYKNLIKRKLWCPSCIPWANEYQWETCFTDVFLYGLISLL